MIRVFQPTLGPDELKAIGEVFADQWPGNGPRVKAFEHAFAAYIGVDAEQLIAVTSCTEGLFQSVAALELCSTDEVILPTISFIGAAHAVSAAGARLRLVDVDPYTLNPRPEHIADALTSETRAILLLHFGGRLDWIYEIGELAKSRNIALIEDSACALGGRQNGISYGTFGEIGVWSFDSMKLLVTGDGGMIRVSDERVRRRIFNRVHLGGVRTGLEVAASNSESWWEVNPVCCGRLSFMNDVAAAIGQVQLSRLANFIERRKRIAQAYDSALASASWLRLPPPQTGETVPYFYWIQTPPGIRDNLARYLRERQIYTTFRYWPLHRTKLYGDSGSYPGAEVATDATLLLPVHQNLSDSDVERIVDAVKAFMR
ncbi:MAG TPA: DegT/DnrJ/EryC1/StrS family aminotransferase [Pyrinomonadaceae bacterium]|nr:DegT/DnrJ/EryC1/StrS family aminotransferase [Pyrinomonadaceae bacterium]